MAADKLRSLALPEGELRAKFEGFVTQNSFCLSDVDNDGENELIAGSAKGELSIFKVVQNEKGSPVLAAWASSQDLGYITAVCVGDLKNAGSNVLVVATDVGVCHVFDVGDEASAGDASTSPRSIAPNFSQRLPANIKEVLMFDVDNDGAVELVIGLTDRVVRTYQWQTREEDGACALTPVHKWEFGRHVGSITAGLDVDGTNLLIVAQPGGALLKVKCNRLNEDDDDSASSTRASKMGDMNYEPMASHKTRNQNVSSEIKGGFISYSDDVCNDEDKSSPYAICTLDGTLTLARNSSVLWTFQTHKPLFCVRKMDVTGDGVDEVVVSSWSGHMYIATQRGVVYEYVTEESVRTFTCGMLKIHRNGVQQPVLVHLTFKSEIVVHHGLDLTMDSVVVLGLEKELAARLTEEKVRLKTAEAVAEANRFLLYCA